MEKAIRFGLGLLIAGLVSVQVSAQPKASNQQADSQPASFAIRTGLTQLYGDLKDPLSRPFIGVSLMIPITKTVTVEVPADFGTLRSQQDEFYHSIAKTKFIQIATTASVDLLEWFGQGQKRVEIRPYAGAGLLIFRAEAYDLTTGKLQRQTNNQNSHRSRDGIESRGKAGIKMTHELVWVMGLRGSTALSRRMSVFGDVRFNVVRTDKLDATLDNNNRVLGPGTPVYTEGNHYGKNSHDKWGYASVGLNWYFGERFRKN